METVAPYCPDCRHYRPAEDLDDENAFATCAAFPEGIPGAIWEVSVDHRKPIAGDGGIQFEPRPNGKPFPYPNLFEEG